MANQSEHTATQRALLLPEILSLILTWISKDSHFHYDEDEDGNDEVEGIGTASSVSDDGASIEMERLDLSKHGFGRGGDMLRCGLVNRLWNAEAIRSSSDGPEMRETYPLKGCICTLCFLVVNIGQCQLLGEIGIVLPPRKVVFTVVVKPEKEDPRPHRGLTWHAAYNRCQVSVNSCGWMSSSTLRKFALWIGPECTPARSKGLQSASRASRYLTIRWFLWSRCDRGGIAIEHGDSGAEDAKGIANYVVLRSNAEPKV
ncbi:hypothetical protein TOPH_07537 [Tolypocladium ophioglossoides CBS 100239]|uniref:Uncharacterized protein n=1 Tax=Tolypocladium ophioglossoides (strain CBS 100239) TaxID=1163406 RepID=A0A0L0N156_TOLOC|nr:hypothetical protein TOPH_07537 [Tolypocladium ophioglossoides CBS 100239]